MENKKKIFFWIPNFITSLSIFSGTLATIFAIDGQLGWAGVFICIAAVLDFLDGFSARLLNAYSAMGKELDSLADVISFGIAPGAILFTLLEFSLFGKNQLIQEIEADWGKWAILYSAFLIPIFSALRLAKFNIDTNQTKSFIGFPTPANALLWASFGLMLEFPEYKEVLTLIFTTKNLLILGIVTSLLLVSRIPMFSFKFSNLRWKENWYRYIFLTIAIFLLIFFNVYGIPLIIFLYIITSFVFYLVKFDFE